jgi:hypothetical protein
MAAKKPTTKKTSPVAEVAAEISLKEIADAGANGVFTSPAVHGPLVEAGLVEINQEMINEKGEIATRATQKGFESLFNVSVVETPLDDVEGLKDNETSEAQPAVSGTIQKVKTMFKIEDSIPIPAITGRGRTGCSYPFDLLAIGQSFFVASDEDKPNAAKSLASTVSSATARYAVPSADGATKTNKKGEVVPVMVETRKFVVRSVEENGVKGARVWRTS